MTKGDLISREEAIKALGDIHPLDYNARAYKSKIESIPSADILDQARAIKENCEQFSECEGCRFYNGLPFRCTFGICPQEWKLPEGEKKSPTFIDSAPLKDCKNKAESYGEICVRCNKCGRFGKEKE